MYSMFVCTWTGHTGHRNCLKHKRPRVRVPPWSTYISMLSLKTIVCFFSLHNCYHGKNCTSVTSVIFQKKLPKVNNHPVSENSPNLVTPLMPTLVVSGNERKVQGPRWRQKSMPSPEKGLDQHCLLLSAHGHLPRLGLVRLFFKYQNILYKSNALNYTTLYRGGY
jgi:hypothetical protein